MKRNTIQKRLISETVKKLNNHPTADEVYEELVKQYPSISRTTVYRVLHELDSSGEIRLRRMPNGADRYDHICTDHYHVRCSVCGRVSDVEMDYLSELELKIKDGHGYLFSGHNIVFSGICPDCRETKK